MTPPTKTPENVPALHTGGKVAAIVPTTFNEAVQIAGAIVRAGMAPRGYDNAEKATVAILAGLEVGFTPFAALQSIAVINGTPAVYGDGLVALVRASGLLEDMQEGLDVNEKGEPQAAWCKVKRKGEASWKERMLTRPECARAGWLNKQGPWTATPGRMMTIRVRAWLFRDVFADVLRGLKSAEEVQDMVDITPVASAEPPPAEPKRSDFVAKPAATEAPATATGKPPYDEKESERATQEEIAAAGGQVVTDVQDLNDGSCEPEEPEEPGEPESLVFEEYTKAGEFFEFADPWLQEAHTEAEIIAFGAFYHKYMQERLKPDFRSPRVHEAMLDTKALYDDALAKAQKRR